MLKKNLVVTITLKTGANEKPTMGPIIMLYNCLAPYFLIGVLIMLYD